MRLPTVTLKQEETENARQLHEELYRGFSDTQLQVFYPVSMPEYLEEKQKWLSSNLKGFWLRRGFAVVTRQSKDPCGVYLWLKRRQLRPQEFGSVGEESAHVCRNTVTRSISSDGDLR